LYGIVGYGVVGKSTHKGILKNIKDVTIYDINMRDSDIKSLKNMKYIFFCIPTNDSNDVKHLIAEIKNLKKINKNFVVIVRSTVPVGTCKIIETEINEKIIYIPEFVRDRCWEKDCVKRPYIVGHNNINLPNFILEDEFIECSLAEAELTKMFSNNIAVLKIIFANHMYDLSKLTGADYNQVVKLYDTVKVDQSYLEANDDLRGFGGKCLPKDLDFIIDTFNQANLKQTLFNSLKDDNTKWKTTVRKY
jgi:UDPglucose 6-dehydrogenase